MKGKAPEIDRIVGARLREARILRGLTMKDVGRALGVSEQAVQKWETGKAALSAARLVQLRAAFAIGPEELIDVEAGTSLHRDLVEIAKLVRAAASRLARERGK